MVQQPEPLAGICATPIDMKGIFPPFAHRIGVAQSAKGFQRILAAVADLAIVGRTVDGP